MPFGWVAAAIGAVGVATQMDQGRRAGNQAQDAMDQQAEAQRQQQAQADAALRQQAEALQAQLAQQQAAMTMQQQAYDAQLAQARDVQAQQQVAYDQQLEQARLLATQQQDQFNKSYAQAQQSAAQQAADSAAQLGNLQTQMKLQQEAMNKANQKTPDLAGIDAKNRQASRSGQGGTLLTGAGGVQLDKLLLGRSALLGA